MFLVLAFDSEDGQATAPALIYLAIAAGDYVDGFLARATGQYSRMGALLDPVTDRLTILSGAAVCWHFELLPRWALAVLVVREAVMLLMAQYYVRHGQELEINWYGRIAVFPIMGAIFWAMVVESVVWNAMLIVGVGLSVVATIAYARTGLRALGAADATEPSTPG